VRVRVEVRDSGDAAPAPAEIAHRHREWGEAVRRKSLPLFNGFRLMAPERRRGPAGTRTRLNRWREDFEHE